MGDFHAGPGIKTLPSSAGDSGAIPAQGAKIPHALWPKSQSIKQKQYKNKVRPQKWSPPKSSDTGIGQDCEISIQAFPGGPMFNNLPANAGHVGSVLGLGRSRMLQGN